MTNVVCAISAIAIPLNKDNKIIGKTAIDIEIMTLCFQSL